MNIGEIQGQFHNEILFASILGVAVVVLIVAVCVFYFAFKKSKILASNSQNANNAIHVEHVDKKSWRKDIDEIVEQYHSNKITKDQACAELAAIVRKYVSRMSGEDIKTHTLGEISSLRLKWRNKKGADMLRQTIAALYPSEFANCNENENAHNTTVEQASEWVLVLLEGWQTKGQRHE